MVDRASSVLSGRHLRLATAVCGTLLFVVMAILPGPAPWFAGPAHAAPTVVGMTTAGFDPAQVNVLPGTVVTWEPRDGRKHRIRSTAGPVKFDSGGLNPGESFTFTFAIAGSYAYVDDERRNEPGSTGAVEVATSATPPTGGGGGGAPPTAGGTVSASMANRAFAPASFSVTVGTTIAWTNNDREAHTVTARSGAFDSGNLNSGAGYRYTFGAVGSFPFVCTVHPSMVGVVNVAAAGAPPPPPAPVPTPAPAPPPPPPPPAGSNSIQVLDYRFQPATITVAPNTTLTWTNLGQALHTVTAEDGSFDSGNVRTGGLYVHPFTTPGTYRYVCVIHPEMVATVLVTGASGAPPPPAATTTTVAVPPPPTTGGVKIVDFAFEPTSTTVGVGGSVTFVNAGVARHTVTARDGSFDSGLLARAGTYRREFPTAGTFEYFCTLHPQMVGTVRVTGAGGAPPPPPAATTVPPPVAPAAGDVTMFDFSFSPAQLTVAAGGTVTFANNGQAPHTATAADGSFDSGIVNPGKTFKHAFPTPGTFTYVCDLHPQMSATIVVAGADGAPPPTAAPATTRAPLPPARGDVVMSDFAFSPTRISVVAGGSVSFANNGQAPHTVTARDGSFDSGTVAAGRTYSRTFPTPGTYSYYCMLHPQMSGTVSVSGADGAAPPPEVAPAAITRTELPPGTGDVKMIDFAFEPTQLTVVAGGSVTFANAGQAPHTVTARDGTFDSGMVQAGGTWVHTFDQPGTFPYFCDLHPQMTGAVLVTGRDGSAPPPAAVTDDGPPPLVLTATVDIADDGYQPSSVTVALGGTVTWRMKTDSPHYVTADDGTFDSGLMVTGRTFSHTFNTPGSFGYHDKVVPAMAGRVTVVDPAAVGATGSAPDGRSAGVAIVDNGYDPASVMVGRGGTVSWTNTGQAKHTVTAKDDSWTSDLLAFGGRYEKTFADPGTYEYYCTLHPGMVGTVVVTDETGSAPAAAGSAGEGRGFHLSMPGIGGLLVGGLLVVVLAALYLIAIVFWPGRAGTTGRGADGYDPIDPDDPRLVPFGGG